MSGGSRARRRTMRTTWRGGLGAGLVVAVVLTAVPAQTRTPARSQAPQLQSRPAATPQAPTQRPGQAPAPLPPLPVTQTEERLASPEEQAFSLSFSEPVAIRELLLLMLRGTSYSVVLDPDVDGTFTGELKDVTLKRALDAALRPLNLQYTLEDNLLHVFKRTTETRLFNLNYVATRRTGSRGVSAATGAGGAGFGAGVGGAAALGGGGVFAAGGTGVAGAGATGLGGGGSVSSTDSTDFFGEVEKGIETLRSGDSKFNLDRKAGVLQITDYPDRLEKVQTYLDLVQLRVNRQVQIQAKVLEVDLNQDAITGINWSTVFRSAGNSVTLTQQMSPTNLTSAFTLGVNIRDFTGLLQAFATQGKVNVLSSPRVAAMNNEPAIFRAGTQDIFFNTTSQIDATTGRILQSAVTPQSLTEGVVLSVTPQISADGVIQMSISPTVTERTGQATSRLGDTVPIVSVREADTLVRVHEGETVVIAGLMQERSTADRSKVPVLGDIPLLGGLFRQDTTSKRKTELVILLTPTIMTPAEIAADAAREQERMYEAQKAPTPIKK